MEGEPIQAKADLLTEPGSRHNVRVPRRIIRVQFVGEDFVREYNPRTLEERTVQWNDRRMRFFAWNTPMTQFAQQDDEPSLKDEIRNGEQDELKKMEQERLEKQGTRRTQDHLGREGKSQRDQDGLRLSQTVQGDQDEGPMEADREQLNQMQRERPYGSSHIEDGGGDAQRLGQGDRGNLEMGEVTQYRTSGVIRSPQKLTANRRSISRDDW
jgi:hypothetical protein